ncbi:MAG: hypothetical protein SFT81_01905 [Candidatus Caenarcaniphilales bacterium]|nr:hypothetical protein [Candidatus Caenarcaniphilales bacterium]
MLRALSIKLLISLIAITVGWLGLRVSELKIKHTQSKLPGHLDQHKLEQKQIEKHKLEIFSPIKQTVSLSLSQDEAELSKLILNNCIENLSKINAAYSTLLPVGLTFSGWVKAWTLELPLQAGENELVLYTKAYQDQSPDLRFARGMTFLEYLWLYLLIAAPILWLLSEMTLILLSLLRRSTRNRPDGVS